ncbi:hypothetical protein F4604DRAFT_1880188 [Suillus subluteus]|nr:hypothetical protein F4604DRAFT_1880188 [Suillus subluteus]
MADNEDPESEFTNASGCYYCTYHSLLNDHKDLHKVIDTTQLGNVPWQCLSMDKEYEVWYRDPCVMAHNMLANPTYKDFMSGDLAWQQADEISKDPNTHGSMFILIILGSDKTTVSVGMGNNEYYPLYASIGNVHNNVRHAHCNALIIIGFLSIPKTNRKHAHDDSFHLLCCQLFHCLLSTILSTLKPVMTEYKVLHCADGHFRRIIFGLGHYIANYEEQLVLSCTIKNWCPKCLASLGDLDGGGLLCCQEHTDILIHENIHSDTLWHEYGIISVLIMTDIHKLISFDLLHQLVKGAFKDHLVDWVVKYLRLKHGTKRGDEIMSDIDHRITVVVPFAGLWQFPDGCGFKQWTGFILAIEGHVPQDMVCTFCALLEFSSLGQLNDVLALFHHYRQIFETTGTVPHFSLPCQHSMTHYVDMIRLKMGKCLQCKHIKAVKEPWWWSNKHNTLGQMLLTNQCLDKLAASHLDFTAMGCSSVLYYQELWPLSTVPELADEVNIPHLRHLIYVPATSCPQHDGGLYVFNSAAAMFYAPSDPSNIGSMRREQIRTCPLWQNISAHNGCVFVNINPDLEGMKGLEVDDCADEDTGMWIVHPSVHDNGTPNFTIIHIETVYHAVHLIPVYAFNSYDAFQSFCVNKYADHHAFEIAS